MLPTGPLNTWSQAGNAAAATTDRPIAKPSLGSFINLARNEQALNGEAKAPTTVPSGAPAQLAGTSRIPALKSFIKPATLAQRPEGQSSVAPNPVVGSNPLQAASHEDPTIEQVSEEFTVADSEEDNPLRPTALSSFISLQPTVSPQRTEMTSEPNPSPLPTAPTTANGAAKPSRLRRHVLTRMLGEPLLIAVQPPGDSDLMESSDPDDSIEDDPMTDDESDSESPAEELTQSHKPIGTLGVDIGLGDKVTPYDKYDYARRRFASEGKIMQGPGSSRPWTASNFAWKASAMHHRPLYFQEINVERHGYGFGIWQPGISAAHFFANTLALPYKMAAHHPNECIYTLGYYRPGSCVPYYINRWPADLKGASLEAGLVTGLIFLIP